MTIGRNTFHRFVLVDNGGASSSSAGHMAPNRPVWRSRASRIGRAGWRGLRRAVPSLLLYSGAGCEIPRDSNSTGEPRLFGRLPHFLPR